ncbi:hypothetical protein D3C81_625460 [compost metagenome]
MAQAVQVQVNHRRRIKGEDLAEHQATDDGQAQRLTHFCAFSLAQQQRQCAKDRCQGGHQDRPQAQQAGPANRLFRRKALMALQLQGQVDHQDGILFHHPDQQEQPQQRDQAELATGDVQRQQGTDARRRQCRENGQRVNVAFIQNTQHQVHQQQCAKDHEWLALLGLGKGIGSAAELGNHLLGQAQFGHRALQCRHGLIGAVALGDVEGDVFRSELAFVADPVVGQAVLVVGDGRQRYAGTVGGNHLHLLEGARVPGVLRVDLQHHLVLVEAVVDGGDLPLAVGVVQYCGDHVHVDAQALGLVTVDHQRHLLGTGTIAGVDGGQLRQCTQRRDHLGKPFAQRRQVAALQGIQVLRGSLITPSAPQLQVLVSHQEQAPAGHFGQLLAQALDHLLRIDLALADRFQAHQHHGVVGTAVATDETGNTLYCRVGQQGTPVDFHFRLHHAERQAVVAADKAHQLAGVLLRHQRLGHHHVQGDVDADGGQQAEQGQALVAQGPAQAAVIGSNHALMQLVAPALQACLLGLVRLEPAGAEHRCKGERHHQRDDDRRRQGDGKLLEQVAHDAAHEQDGDEHRHQRHVHRQQGEAHLLGAQEGRLHRRLAVLDVPGDVFQHHDGIVHHQPGGKDQRHQRQVVERETAHVHDCERTHQRYRHRQAGDQRGAQAAEEQVDHQDHQHHGDQQGVLGFLEGCLDHWRTVHGHVQLHAGRQQRLQGRQLRLDLVDRFDDVGAGLAVDHQQHRCLVVEEAAVVTVFNAVGDSRHVR